MAKIQKEEPIVDEFYLPLTPGELKEMWNKYANDKGILMFTSPFGHTTTGKELYLNDNKIMTYDKKYGWGMYQPNYKELPKYLAHWKEFEEYAQKRAFATQEQNSFYGEQL